MKYRYKKRIYSGADMCGNCSLAAKSMKFGMLLAFKVLRSLGYRDIPKIEADDEKIEKYA